MTSPATAGQADPSRSRILLVEDHPDMREILSELLVAMGHRVVVRGSVAGALEQCRIDPPDLVLCDLTLPDGDGVGLVRELRERHGLPCIVLTARGDERSRRLSLEAGAAAHLTKGTSTRRIDQVIRTILEG